MSACSFGLSATGQQYFSLTTNQPPATSQQYSSLRTNQHQPSATSQSDEYFETEGVVAIGTHTHEYVLSARRVSFHLLVNYTLNSGAPNDQPATLSLTSSSCLVHAYIMVHADMEFCLFHSIFFSK
jgi:hypothetical protein